MKLKLITICIFLITNACSVNKQIKNFYKVDESGLSPFDNCSNDYSEVLGGIEVSKVFCECLMPKIIEQFKKQADQYDKMQEGGISEISEENKKLTLVTFQECFSSSGIDNKPGAGFSDELKSSYLSGLRSSLQGTEIQESKNVKQFCNCMMSEVENRYSAYELISGISETIEYGILRDSCFNAVLKSK